MHCYKCGTENCSKVDFCYNCGAKISNNVLKTNIPNKIKKDVNNCSLFLFNKIININNKYVSIFICMVIFVLSTSFFTVLFKNFPLNLKNVIDLIYQENNVAPYLYKSYLEQCCRDLWCRLFLIIIFFLLAILSIFMFFRLLKIYKNKKIKN